MRNRNELFVVIATAVFLAFTMFTALNMGTGCGKGGKGPSPQGKVRTAAQAAQCTSNLKQLTTGHILYASTFNDFVTPIAWDDGVNIWPALIWNQFQQSNGHVMPYENYSKDKDKWLPVVKNSHLFECPFDDDSDALPDSPSDMPKLSYAINRSAVRNMKSSANAVQIPSGPVLKVTKFKMPSRMIYLCDTSWNKSASGADAPGRLYSAKIHPFYGFKPGSICHHWDQGQIAPEFNGGGDATMPWHHGKTWNYSFIDGHAENLLPEQTIKKGSNVADRVPSGFWTWNGEPWGADE